VLAALVVIGVGSRDRDVRGEGALAAG
jgi:hypothetical protein